MKKLVSIILSIISVICISLTFIGCEEKQTKEDIKKFADENARLKEEYNYQIAKNNELSEENKQLVEINSELSEENKQLIEENSVPAINKIKTIENGKFYTLKTMYDNGLLKVDDLKSIACNYYDFYKYEENPYSGMYDPHETLSKENEEKIKYAFLDQIVKNTELLTEGVDIINYYGTYNGNIVVKMYSDYICIYPTFIPSVSYIGGVKFKNFCDTDIFVFHN